MIILEITWKSWLINIKTEKCILIFFKKLDDVIFLIKLINSNSYFLYILKEIQI